MPAPAPPEDGTALVELESLLCEVAAGGHVNRAEATAYSNYRARLIASPVRGRLPGFLHQCVSLLRFKEFITLYDPDIGARRDFVRRGFDPCHALLKPARPAPPPRADEPHHWML